MKSTAALTSSVPSELSSRLNRHFTACSAAAACVAGGVAILPHAAQGAIIYSGVQNLAIPGAGAQLYINLVTGATSSAAASMADWDLAPYGGGLRNQPSYAAVTVLLGANTANLVLGTLIDASSNLGASTGGVQDVAIPPTTTGIIGFKFNPASLNGFTPAPNGTPTNYGWLRLTTGTVGAGGGTVVDWAYESTPETGIAAGATSSIPEPSALACLALGALGLGSLRRRKANAATGLNAA